VRHLHLASLVCISPSGHRRRLVTNMQADTSLLLGSCHIRVMCQHLLLTSFSSKATRVILADHGALWHAWLFFASATSQA